MRIYNHNLVVELDNQFYELVRPYWVSHRQWIFVRKDQKVCFKQRRMMVVSISAYRPGIHLVTRYDLQTFARLFRPSGLGKDRYVRRDLQLSEVLVRQMRYDFVLLSRAKPFASEELMGVGRAGDWIVRRLATGEQFIVKSEQFSEFFVSITPAAPAASSILAVA